MVSKARPERTGGSRKREKLEAEEFIASMHQRRMDWAMYLAVFLGVVFAIVVLLQAIGYSNLPSKPFYVIVASLVATITYVVRATYRRY